MPDAAPAYDHSNVFARILRGELPAHAIHEDERTLAFMDIMPRGDGHALVVPKAPARTILDIGDDDLAAVMRSARLIARAGMRAFGAQGITLQQFNESAGGQVVFHLHVHVIPRFEGVALRPHTADMAPGETLAAHALRYREALAALDDA